MKIIFIADEDQKYGAAHSLLELVTCLSQKYNQEIIVLTCRNGVLNEKLDELQIENYITGHAPFLIGEGSTRIKRIIKKYLKFMMYLRYQFKNFLALRKAKKIIDFKKVDLIYTNVNRIDFGAILSKRFHIPHVWHIREFGDNDYKLSSFRINYIEFMNKHANVFVTISNAVKNAWIKKGIDSSKVKMVYNGIDMENISTHKGINNEKVNIVFTGSINDTKQQIQVIDALGKLPKDILQKVNIEFYGSGTKEYLSYLTNVIKQYNIERFVTFKGYKENVTSLLSRYDVGIICSRAEGFGRVTVEYMAAGLCVIASDTGANSELITDKHSGFLYKYGNINEFANLLGYLVNNKSKCKEIGNNARKVAIENFSMERNAREIFSLIEDVL